MATRAWLACWISVVLGLAGAARADEAAFGDRPAGDSVEALDSGLARAVQERIEKKTLFPGLKAALQHLPPFFADGTVLFNFRSFYFPLLRIDGERADAWTYGGQLRMRSGWVAETAQLGFNLYTSQEISADDPNGRTRLLQPGEKSYTIAGEAFLRLKWRDVQATLFRQELELPYVNRQDNRMSPNSFEAYTVKGIARGVPVVGRIDWFAGWIDEIRPREEDSFRSMAEQAGAPDSEKGMLFGGIQFSPHPGLQFGAYQYWIDEVLSISYAAADYTWKLSADWALRFQGQATLQTAAGGKELRDRSFETWVVGGRAAASWRGLTAWLAVTHTDEEEPIISPFGTYPGFLNLMQSDFTNPGETGVGIGLSVDAERWGYKGLSGFVSYARGFGGEDPATRRGNASSREIDATLDYQINDGWLRGFWLRIRGSLLHVNGADRTGRELRVILNYDIPVL